MTKSVLALVVMVASLGCGRDRSAAPFVERDSAGVRILESRAPQWPGSEAWTLASEPLLDLSTSGTGTPHEFFRVRGAVRLTDGSYAVADGGSSEIRFFSAEGEFLRATGRKGQGPGEFERLRSLHRLGGDSVLAFEWGGRVAVFGPRGRLARMMLLPPNASDLRVLDGTGFLVKLHYLSMDEYGGGNALIRQPIPIVAFSAAGQLLDTVAMAAGGEEFMFVTASGAASAIPLFPKDSHVWIHAHRVYLGSADDMEYRVLSRTGELEEIVRVPGYDLSLSAEEVEAERRARLGDDPPPFTRDVMAALPSPKTRPAYSDLVVDSEGAVWLGAFDRSRTQLIRPSERDWQVFSAVGAWLGSIRFPPRFTVYEIGRDYVLGRRYDDQGVEHVQVLELIRH